MSFPTNHHVRFLDRMAPIRHDNELVVVLTGHLLIEELLAAIVEKSLARPEKLNRKTFYDYICLARALSPTALPEEALNAAEALNKLRNKLAHSLDEQSYQHYRTEFLRFTKANFSEALLSRFGEMWLAILDLHTIFIFAVEFDTSSLRLPTLLANPNDA